MTRRAGAGRTRGFTLIEILIVLTIMGLMLGLIISRGPMRSQRLDMDTAARDLAGTLRLARSEAIARNRRTMVAVNVLTHSFGIEGTQPRRLPPDVDVRMIAVAGLSAGQVLGGISFAPDGSSSGGRVEMAGRGRVVQVGVDWLTGRVSVAETTAQN